MFKIQEWEKYLHLAMEECQPADYYYKFIRTLANSLLEEVENEKDFFNLIEKIDELRELFKD